MRILEVVSHSETETEALAAKLARSFVSGEVVLLRGDLGSGKTTFVRGLAAELGYDPNRVSSPSYTIVNEYRSEPPVYHFDLYRMNDPSELHEIGWDDYLSRNGILLVEWGERAAPKLPSQFYVIDFRILSDSERRIQISRMESE